MVRVLSLLSLVLISFTSCQFSEDLYINEDGTGKMEFSFNGDQLMQMAGDEMAKGEKESIDSTLVFKDFLNQKEDSIAALSAEEQAKLKALEPLSMKMLMNPQEKKMLFSVLTDFKDVNQLQDMMQAMKTMSQLDKPKEENTVEVNPLDAFDTGELTQLSYSMKGNTFMRSLVITDKEQYKTVTDSLEQATMMFAGSTYTLNYHFPRKIKSVSNEAAVIAEDGKSVSVEYEFIKYLTDPESMNLEVVLEDN
ncbi:MAG TPA: hypothetical protein VKZ97_06960 [Flavobacteriaceae bacterium]|nr:hypothetical protein [Flavobacteriaceae bacterium]